MERRTASDIDRRSFINGAGRFAVGALTAGASFEMMRPNYAWAQQVAKVTHPASARVLDRLRTRFTFQISVDVATVEQGLGVAGAALAGGVSIVEMGTPLLKNEGVSNVVPAFRRKFPEALLLADMKTMDGGAFEARAVYAGGGNIVDFLALAGVDTAKAICAVRDEFRRADPNCRGSPLPISSCRTRARPRRPSRSRFACSRPVWTGSAFTCRPTRGAPTRHSSRATISVTWHAPSSSGSAPPPRCRWSAGLASRRRKALPRRGCAPSSSAAISASRTPAPATTCHGTRSSATSPVSSPRSRAPNSLVISAGRQRRTEQTQPASAGKQLIVGKPRVQIYLIAPERRNGIQSRRSPCWQQTGDCCHDDHCGHHDAEHFARPVRDLDRLPDVRLSSKRCLPQLVRENDYGGNACPGGALLDPYNEEHTDPN